MRSDSDVIIPQIKKQGIFTQTSLLKMTVKRRRNFTQYAVLLNMTVKPTCHYERVYEWGNFTNKKVMIFT